MELVNENVFWLDVSVADTSLVEVLEGITKARKMSLEALDMRAF